MRSAPIILALLFVASLAAGQDPIPQPVPAPPRPPEPSAAPEAPTPQANNPWSRKTSRTPWWGAGKAPRAQDDQLGEATRAIQEATNTDRLLDEAAEATGLDRKELRPAIKALRALWSQPAGESIGSIGLGRDGRIEKVWTHPNGVPAPGAADEDLAEAVAALPEDKREAFVAWATDKRKQVAELGARVGEAGAKAGLKSLFDAQRELERARDITRMWEGRKLATEKEWQALAEAGKTIEAAGKTLASQQELLSEEMSRLARTRIAGALDKDLFLRYRDLATTVDPDATRRMIEKLSRVERDLRVAETQPEAGGPGLEQRIEDLTKQRHAIDEALERAMTELVRERAQKLHEEAEKRAAAAHALADLAKPVLTPPAPQTPRPVLQAPDANDAELQKLREELRKLRDEVDALRKKGEPK